MNSLDSLGIASTMLTANTAEAWFEVDMYFNRPPVIGETVSIESIHFIDFYLFHSYSSDLF